MPHKDARCRGLQVPPSHGRVGVGGKKTCTHHLAFGWAEASSPPLLLALLTPSAKPLCLGVPDAEAPDAGASRRWPLLRAESEVAGAPIGRERSTPVSTTAQATAWRRARCKRAHRASGNLSDGGDRHT